MDTVYETIKKRKKFAFCIPTYNRSSMVEEFLDQFASLYEQLEIDICYFDSSEDDKTEAVVHKWMNKYQNIQYTRILSKVPANRKVMQIYKQYAQYQDYDYLWICGDSLRFSETILRKIISVLDSGYDMLVINGIDQGRIGTREYTDGNELFQDCAWYMTLFGAVIVNVPTMLCDVPWSYIEETYEIPERLNYSHIGLYFEIICNMKMFRAIHLAADHEISGSQLKPLSEWQQDAFRVLCEYWPSTVNALPDYYKDKWSAIYKLGYCSCLSLWHILNYRLANIYNIQVFFRYRMVLKGMTCLNSIQLLGIACLKPKLSYFIATNDLYGCVRECRKLYRLRRYCKKNTELYIYGAGKVAERYAAYFERRGIAFQGFLVTRRDGNMDIFQDHPVIPLCEFDRIHDNVGIIVGLGQQNIKNIEPVLIQRGLWSQSFHEYIIPVMLID